MSTTLMDSLASHPKVLTVIPARYASTRFPGKPLVEIAGKPMIQHVWERVNSVSTIGRTIVATDDERIYQAVRDFGGEVRMTSSDHPSGTDRVWEVAQAFPEYTWVMNVQGDEPFVEPEVLEKALNGITAFPLADIITLDTPITDIQDWHNPNIVKSVVAESGQALYFSRAAVPYERDNTGKVPINACRHIGLYIYKREALERFTQLPPSRLEQVEKLEQLRALEYGMRIYNVVVEKAAIGIDTPADLERMLSSLSR